MWHETTPTIVTLTQAQYNALDPADQTNGTIYFISDAPLPTSGGLNATNVNVQTAEYTTVQ